MFAYLSSFVLENQVQIFLSKRNNQMNDLTLTTDYHFKHINTI